MADINVIIDKLLERTKQDKINWRPTLPENTFLAVIGKLGVSIALPNLSTFDSIVRFRVVDQTGQLVKEINADRINDAAIYYKLREIHQQARLAALGDESHLDELLAELERV